MLKNFTKINHDEKVALLQKLIKKNVSLDLSNSDNWKSSDDDDLEMGRTLSSFLSKSIDNAESDWCTSDEKTLDVSKPLKKATFIYRLKNYHHCKSLKYLSKREVTLFLIKNDITLKKSRIFNIQKLRYTCTIILKCGFF
jgi:hypothetical protein